VLVVVADVVDFVEVVLLEVVLPFDVPLVLDDPDAADPDESDDDPVDGLHA